MSEPTPPVKIRVDELVVSGASTLSSAELNEITNSLTGREFADNTQEMSERLIDAFRQHGYFHPEIKNFKLGALDPLGNPKPVRIEAEVNEGIRFRVAAFKFEGMRAFSAEKLLSELPIRAGEYFNVEKIRSGLTSIRNLYQKQGYLLAVPVPNTEEGSDGTITVTFDIDEGPQFRMGSVAFTAERDVAEQLRSHWLLAAGELYDGDYTRKFIDENKALLPQDFNSMSDVEADLNCREGIIDLRIDADPKHPKMPPAKLVGCDTPSASEKASAREQ